MYRETLDKYMAFNEGQEAKIERYDNQIEEISVEVRYFENAQRLGCIMGICKQTPLPFIVKNGTLNVSINGTHMRHSWAGIGRTFQIDESEPFRYFQS